MIIQLNKNLPGIISPVGFMILFDPGINRLLQLKGYQVIKLERTVLRQFAYHSSDFQVDCIIQSDYFIQGIFIWKSAFAVSSVNTMERGSCRGFLSPLRIFRENIAHRIFTNIMPVFADLFISVYQRMILIPNRTWPRPSYPDT